MDNNRAALTHLREAAALLHKARGEDRKRIERALELIREATYDLEDVVRGKRRDADGG